MSNVTVEDLDTRLTETRNEFAETDLRLWESLEDEKVSRIAGDEANNLLIQEVKTDLTGTESRLSTEVIHRSEGDINNINSLSALTQALSDYRIKTDLEINAERIARQQLGVDLNVRMDGVVASFNHKEYLLYTAIADVQSDVDGKYSTMDSRIRKYEDMLQDITTDSIQIHMDNGEINMGAWTILSQAREWDLEILADVKKFQVNISKDVSDALEDFQKQMPVEENIINNALDAFANSGIVSSLDDRISQTESGYTDLHSIVDQNKVDLGNEIIGMSDNFQVLLNTETSHRETQVNQETSDRIEAIQRESEIRQMQLQNVDENVGIIGTSVENLEIKLEEFEGEFKGTVEKLEGIQLTVAPLKASGTWKVSSTKKDAASWSLRYAQIDGDKVISKEVNTVSTTVGSLTATVQQISESVNGLEASYTVRIDSNGLVAGFGLYNDSETSAFAVNANQFYVGDPVTGKKPFMVLTQEETINGTTYPAGTWIDVALIANATIGTAHITDASITNAKIVNLSADKITSGFIDADRIAAGSITAEKLTIGDTSNLWNNQNFDESKGRPQGDRSDWYPFTIALQGGGVQVWGREHNSPWSSKTPVKPDSKLLIEFIGKQNLDGFSPTIKDLEVGFKLYGEDGLTGPSKLVKATAVRGVAITGGWYKYSALVDITNVSDTVITKDGLFTMFIDQSDTEIEPVAWILGNLVVRSQMGGELIVNGSITSDKINVTNLSAITATIGLLRTSDSGARTEIADNLITVYDDNNNVRLKLGIF